MKWYYKYGFTPEQFKGYIVICVLILIAIGIKAYNRYFNYAEVFVYQSTEEPPQTIDTISNYVVFNPNKVSTQVLIQNGLSEKVATRLVNYVSKGGQFKSKKEVLKIYGLDTAWFERVEEYIIIPPLQKDVSTSQSNHNKIQLKQSIDINAISASELENLGFDHNLTKRLIKYRDKSGGFKKPEDILKIYGFDTSDFYRNKSLITIGQPKNKMDSLKNIGSKKVVLVHLNLADSTTLLTLNGIGPIYANRIIKYRNRLGGFADKQQLLEVFGMDSIRLNGIKNYLILEENSWYKINVNTTEFKTLLKHPYFNYNQVKAIVGFRETIRPLTGMPDLIKLGAFTQKDTLKLKPYLLFN